MKIEDKYALDNVEETLKFRALLSPSGVRATWLCRWVCAGDTVKDPADAGGARQVFAAVKANIIFFLNSFAPATWST